MQPITTAVYSLATLPLSRESHNFNITHRALLKTALVVLIAYLSLALSLLVMALLRPGYAVLLGIPLQYRFG
jgi:hypothetical protein